jgi:hypothetical protein
MRSDCQYSSNAERQRAHRERKAEELQRLRKATAKVPALQTAEIKRLQQRVTELEAALTAARSTKPAVSGGPVRAWSEPFPHVRSGVGGDDIESSKIRDWFENRIIEGSIGTSVLKLAAINLDYLAQAYWAHGGKPKPCKRLSSEQKAAVIAACKNQTPKVPLTPDQKLERLKVEKRGRVDEE